MGLTTALFTGLSGINSAQFRLDTIGNNIANVNTTGYKGTRSMFQTQFSQTLTGGSAPNGTSGGTNPLQLGLGSVLGSVQRLFTAGSIETTGFPTDLALEGEGFFVLRSTNNEQVFTRDGAFTLNSTNHLVSQTGFFVQGYGVDASFKVVPGVLQDLTIPLGTLAAAQATTNASLGGALNSSGTLGTSGTTLQSQALVIDALGTPLASTATLATDLRSASAPGTTLLNAGDTVRINGVKRGGQDVGARTLTITATTTVGDILQFLDDAAGIDTSAGLPGTPGTSISGGKLQLTGNVGTANAIEIGSGALLSSNATTPNPFVFTQTQAANGESVRTSFQAYDSLGTPITVNLTAVLEQRANGSNTWRYYAYSADDSDSDTVIGTGTLSFDSNGVLVPSNVGARLQIDRANTGATTPMLIDLDFSRMSGLTTRSSTMVMTNQDGFATGTLIDFTVGPDGVITGTFSNGQARTLGQVAVGTFANNSGLVQRANNVYAVGANSGAAQISAPLSLGAGRVLAGSLELSNVDLSQEFVGLISASTAFSAASRVISTSDQLLQDLLLLGRR